MRLSFFFLFLIWPPSISLGQSVVEDLSQNDDDVVDLSSLPTERIQRISQSRRIFIISNENNSVNKGDFITLLYKSKKGVRALVAKEQESQVGIKILKIYSLSVWNQLARGIEVQIIRGDAHPFLLSLKEKNALKDEEKAKEKEKDANRNLIQDEEDLFNETLLEEDALYSLDDEISNRNIKNDNVFTVSVGKIDGRDENDNRKSYTQVNGAWAYQLLDNFFVEALFGQNLVRDYPALGLDTKMLNYTARLRYTIPTHFFIIIWPYIGYQRVDAYTPGIYDKTGNPSEIEIEHDERQVEDLRQERFIYGISIMRRLVPGWFVGLHVGVDIINIGLALEF